MAVLPGPTLWNKFSIPHVRNFPQRIWIFEIPSNQRTCHIQIEGLEVQFVFPRKDSEFVPVNWNFKVLLIQLAILLIHTLLISIGSANVTINRSFLVGLPGLRFEFLLLYNRRRSDSIKFVSGSANSTDWTLSQ